MGIYGGFMGFDLMGFFGGDLPTGKHTTTNKKTDAHKNHAMNGPTRQISPSHLKADALDVHPLGEQSIEKNLGMFHISGYNLGIFQV